MTLAEWWAVTRWEIAQDTGWTLDAIEELSFEDVWEYLSLRDASARVRGKD